METTPRLGLELVQAQQAQKHVTVNESFRRLDALVQLSAVSATTAEEPASPSAGAIYILPAGKSGSAWSAMAEGALAAYQDGAWVEIVPAKGWRAFIEDEAALRIFGGLDWAVLGETQERLGLNTTASDTNRLAVKSDAALLSHDDVTPGSGDARQMINKSAEEKTASVVFQTAWSGRAEFGLNGDDDFSLKVSANGADWREAARFAKADGKASFPSGLKHPETGFAIRSILPVPGGDGVVSIYRIDVTRDQCPRMATIAGLSGGTLTLASAVSDQFFNNAMMENVSRLRIWNTSKSPAQSAWVKKAPAANQLEVTSAAHIATWAAGETIQVGDPETITPGRVIALDISPMLQAVFGTVFPQAGAILKIAIVGNGGEAGIDVSDSGMSGTFFGVRTFSGGIANTSQYAIPCSQLSPISNSNLIFIREQDYGGNMGITIASVNALWV